MFSVVRHSAGAVLLLISGYLLGAQTQSTAPIPAQVLGARKIFISNAGVQGNFSAVYHGGANRPYSSFYDGMKQWGHYELVTALTAADVVFEVGFAMGGQNRRPQLNVSIRDPKTNVLLWTVTEWIQQTGGLQRSRDQEFDRAVAALINQLKALAAS